jgi:integrase
MGRRRKHDLHLPPGVRLKNGGYYYRNATTPERLLSRDYGEAMVKYGTLIAGNWSGRTLGDVIDRYRIEVLPLKGVRARVDQGPQLDKLKRVFGHMTPDNVTTQDCYRYLDARKDAPSAGRHEISLLGHVFAKSIRWGVGIGNPVRSLEKHRPKAAKRYVTDEEYLKVWNAATERMRVAMDLALLTGLRQGDVLSLTRADIGDRGLRKETGKTGKVLGFLWTPDLREVIERAKRLSPQVPGTYLVRTREGKPYSRSGFGANWKRTLKKAGVSFKFHDLRKKNASDEPTLAAAQARLGHSSPAITERVYRTAETWVLPLK